MSARTSWTRDPLALPRADPGIGVRVRVRPKQRQRVLRMVRHPGTRVKTAMARAMRAARVSIGLDGR